MIGDLKLPSGENYLRKCNKCSIEFRTYRRGKGKEKVKASDFPRVCAVCGKKFVGTSKSKACSKACHAVLIKSNALKRHNIKKTEDKPRKNKPKYTIDDFIRAQKQADERGVNLSYTEWQATH